MPKTHVEICLISARGLRRSSSLWKLQWFAVGWIDPDHKYCSKIDASGSSNPTWRTKFSACIDESRQDDLQTLTLHVEVYRREPIFLREKLHGTATIALKEFFAKYSGSSEVEEVGSFQLRKKKSGKPQGFVDISVRISEEREGFASYSGTDGGGFQLSDTKTNISLPVQNGPQTYYPPNQPYPPPMPSVSYPPTNNFPYAQPRPLQYGSYSNPSGPGPSYQRPRTPPPPPPPPPANVGFLPTFIPGAGQLPESRYMNVTSSNAAAGRPGFGMGLGAGALAAGAVIFGDDFMSGFDYPTGLQGGSLTISADPPF
ncbi:hypothetical protein ACLOJK_012302 [Asimina triloba]